MSQQKKTLVTAAGPMMAPILRDYSLPTFERFAEAHGYDINIGEIPTDSQDWHSDAGRSARWAKLQILRKTLEKSDIAVWLDADILVCRTDEDIASRLRDDSFQGLVLESVPSEGRVNPNTGVWVMRNCTEAFDFLDAVEEAGPQPGPWMDQGSVLKILGWERGDELYRGARPGIGNAYTLGTTWLPTGWNQPFTDRPDIGEIWHDRPVVPYPYAVHFMGIKHIAERTAIMARSAGQVLSLPGTPPLLELSLEEGTA